MATMFEKVREFHKVFGLPIADKPGFPDKEQRHLRQALLEEEFDEFCASDLVDEFSGFADALADMIYILCGTALAYGIPLDKIFDEVHRANMRKLDVDGNPIRREDGKILKPEGWIPPNIDRVLQEDNEIICYD